MARILIVDDQEQVRSTFQAMLAQAGLAAETAADIGEGLAKGRAGVDVVLLDINLPDGDGLSAVGRFKDLPGNPEVLIITGLGSADRAEKAIKSGAWDYIEKPPSIKEMLLSVRRALEYHAQKASHAVPRVLRRCGILGESPSILACLDLLAAASATLAPVLVSGETGTGKEIFARAIHENSERRQGPFVVVDCAALPENLAESLLFGHEKGAFTGAERAQTGLVRQASGGTLFLDEVGEMSTSLQSKFLRVLQERRFRPVGAALEQESDFRIVAASNRDLSTMAAEGRFREDLLYRLKAVHIELPPLRRRAGDIPLLVTAWLAEFCQRDSLPVKGVSPDFIEVLTRYPWPGNLRELRHVLEQALVRGLGDPMLYPLHLPDHLRVAALNLGTGSQAPGDASAASGAATIMVRRPGAAPLTWQAFKDEVLAGMERVYLSDLLEHAGGNAREAAAASGLGLSRFYELLKRHGLRSRQS